MNEQINENMTYADTPMYCRLVDCGKDAHILLFVVGAGWTPICDDCIADLARYSRQRKAEPPPPPQVDEKLIKKAHWI